MRPGTRLALALSLGLAGATVAVRGWSQSTGHRALPGGVVSRGLSGPVTDAVDESFGAPERVLILGYDGDSMEPFVSRDGKLLLFNDRNEAPNDTKLHWAERIDDVTFLYRSVVGGLNTPAIEGTPSLERIGNLYFVSTRSYFQNLSTVYRGRFSEGAASDIALVSGTSRLTPGWVVFDVEVSADGETLVLSEGLYEGGSVPRSASLVVARRKGEGFERLSDQSVVARLASKDVLTYAAGLSGDDLEIFFTRLSPDLSAPPSIWVASRSSVDDPFGRPRRIAAATGFVEAPSLAPDSRSLYYHRREGSRYVLERLTRPSP